MLRGTRRLRRPPIPTTCATRPNHHFNPIDAETAFTFTSGTYSVEMVAHVIGRRRPISLWKVNLEVPEGAFDSSIRGDTAVFCSWSPQGRVYVASVEKRSGYVTTPSDPKGA